MKNKQAILASFTVGSNHGYHEMMGANQYRATPTRVSIPLAAGVCRPDAALVLRCGRRTLPAVIRPLLLWPDGSVRVWEVWFAATVKREETARLDLIRRGTGKAAPPFPVVDCPGPAAFTLTVRTSDGAKLRSSVCFDERSSAPPVGEDEQGCELVDAGGVTRFIGAMVRRTFTWYPGIELAVRLVNHSAVDVTTVRSVRLTFSLPLAGASRYCIRQSCFMTHRPRLVEGATPFSVRADDHGVHVSDPRQLDEDEQAYPHYERGAYLGMVDNWLGVAGDDGGWMLALPEAGERAPKAWRIRGQKVCIDLHPKDADALHWRQGMALFQRLVLVWLPGHAGAADFENEAQSWLRPPIAIVPAEAYRQAGWRIPFEYEPRRFPKTEFQFRDSFNFTWSTGTFHWGDVIFNWGSKAQGIQPSGRNLEYDFVAVAAKEFARTGRMALWKLGRPAAEHMMYTDFIDYSTDEWKHGGIAAHSPGHTWGSCYPSHMWAEGLTLYYQLTGDRYAWYVMRRVGDFFLKYIDQRFETVQATPREMGWLLIALSAVYDLTRERRYRDGIARVVDFNLALGPQGFFPRDATFAMGVSIIGLDRSRHFYRDADTKTFILGLLDHLIATRCDEIGLFEYWRDSEAGIIPYVQAHLPEGLNIGYLLSGDEKYLRAAWRLYQIFLGGGPLTVQNRLSPTECGFAAGHHLSWSGCLQSFAELGWLDRLQYAEPTAF